ncbi:hypothetical protein P3X46_011703 [Hevea brasiliensis]|uniref:BHLH domain-containing protein n=1 Tax=Hevea brasiliensis TaxID=3981 RepID=A0ABQ9MA23_HEVBR|nr:transcription factor bHLH90 isoform X2 [Hevea brasiliensis]KAJ9176385.1 hypothetical protein P3X46_011703 [Hevea brasiliensis]
MRGLEGALEWLRPLVHSNAWDYCVVWKLGDDPSRFIQWMGCCCGGGGGEVKEERGEENHSAALCRDMYFKHPISTKACEALACFPPFMPLYSGIHGEVVTSTQSKWLTHANASDSNLSPEFVGTRVLIPVFGGLIELFAGKHITKDQKIIEFITAQFNVLKQEALIAHDYSSINELCLDPFLEQNLQNLPPPSHLLSLIPRTQFHHPLNQPNNHSSFEGSSSVSNPSNEHSSFDSHSGHLSRKGILKQSIGKPCGKRKSDYDENLLKQQAGLFPDCNNKAAKVIQRSERENFRSKNLVTERNRRNRMKDGLFTLRALVPKISKMNKAAILGDAIDYIGELQKEEKKLQDELKEIEEQECKNSNAEIIASKLETLCESSKHLLPPEGNQNSSGFGENKKTEVQIELNQIGKREFLIKLFYEHKRGGFRKLMDAIYSFGLQVVDANMTTFNGKVLNILKVEANAKDIQPRKLKESLLKLGG